LGLHHGGQHSGTQQPDLNPVSFGFHIKTERFTTLLMLAQLQNSFNPHYLSCGTPIRVISKRTLS